MTWRHLWPEDQARIAVSQSAFSRLPNELIIHIFKQLNVHDLGSVSSVCRLFKMNADQDEIWKTKIDCKFIFDIASAEAHSKSYKQTYMDLKYTRYQELENIERLRVLSHCMVDTTTTMYISSSCSHLTQHKLETGCFPRPKVKNLLLL